MARKKKSPKNLPPETNKTTSSPPLETQKEKECKSAAGSSPLCDTKKRGSLNDLVLQQTTAAEQKFQQHQSDSEVMALKQKLSLEKNKSNLFLIKSYSFIDRTNNKPALELQKQNTLPESEEKSSLDLINSKEIKENKRKSKSKSNTKLEDKPGKLEKPKKPPKLKKIKKSKSIYDSMENLQDLQDLLRKPSIIPEDEEHKIMPRPQSMPVTQSGHRVIIKAKTLDDIETPRLKRDSFIRHSLQSIRRSFSSSKKYSNNISITSSSSSSNSSSASSNSSAIMESRTKRSKSKSNKQKDIANLQDVEEQNYLISVEEKEQPDGSLHSCQNNLTVKEQNTLKSSNSCALYNTLDPLTVLREEDEKETGMESNNNNLNSPCTNITQRSTSSVSTLAQLPPDSLSPMAPLQAHTECQSVQCLNILDKDYQTSSTSLQNNNTASTSSSSSPPQKQKRGAFQHQLSTPESLQSQSIGCATSSEYTSARSLKNSATSLSPLPSLNSSESLRSISPSRSSSLNNSNSTAKHEQQSTAAASAAAAAAAAAGSQQTSLSSATTATTTTSLTISSSSSNGSSSSSSAATATTNANATTMGASSASIVGMGTAGATTTATTPPEKEKKRKEISSSRVKKFHRHFAQVSKDEKLINYFSCALVSDILLQGHLYITDQHFAFYSNVFGYVTKVVIPTSSVTKISKEKTAKIIPNAVGVATADERHVFGSFISREAAFRLMCSVCPPLGVPEILPKDPANIEITEEYSIEDDSSCSISGNESPAQITELQNGGGAGINNLTTNDANQGGGQTILRRSGGSSNLSINEMRHSDIPKTNAKLTKTTAASSTRSSAPTGNGQGKGGGGSSVNLLGLKTLIQPALNKDNTNGDTNSKLTIIAGCASSTTSATSTPTPSTSSSPTTVMTPGLLPNTKSTSTAINSTSLGGGGGAITKIKERVEKIFGSVNKKCLLHLKFPTEIHVVYLGVMLTLLLSLLSIFLLYRILDIEAKTNICRSPSEFNWRSGNDDDIFAEALRFQQQLQLKSTEEAQNILKTNLEQIAKVRRSLETLSMLIHDRSSSFVSNPTDDSD
ncbi:uncharacterized protein ACRADG_007715 [Cochliomyia hominivorax]